MCKGIIYKLIESEKLLMFCIGGLGVLCGQVFWLVCGLMLYCYGEQLQGELCWKGMVIGVFEGIEVKVIVDGWVILVDWL